MAFTSDFIDDILDWIGTQVGFASLHSADPGDTGASELAGGSPAYARQPITWLASAAGDLSIDTGGTLPVFDVPAGADVAYVGYWSALSGGTFRGSVAVTPEHFTNQGTYALDDLDINATY